MSILHLVKIRFDVRRADITQEWLDTRYSFFQEYTLQSLLKQTNKDWVLWINCQEGMQTKITKLVDILEKSGLTVYYSFGDGNILSEVVKDNPKYTHVYITRLDSDDLYSSDALQLVRSINATASDKVIASMFKRGYKYDVRSKELGVYYNNSSPFHTIMIPRSMYLNDYASIFHKIGDHSKVSSAYFVHGLPDYKFTVLTHEHNFLSSFKCSSDKEERVPIGWTIDRMYDNPIVFDVDDFSDKYNCLDELKQLKARYPKFKCSLFTIPKRISKGLLEEAKALGFIELCPHGLTHEPNEEMKSVSEERLLEHLKSLDSSIYEKGFRPPGWYLNTGVVHACNDAQHWLAMHVRDIKKYGWQCEYGYYGCGDRFDYSHHHTHDCCSNWLLKDLPTLLTKWKENQEFMYVSEAVLI